jgi:hypothetical protein
VRVEGDIFHLLRLLSAASTAGCARRAHDTSCARRRSAFIPSNRLEKGRQSRCATSVDQSQALEPFGKYLVADLSEDVGARRVGGFTVFGHEWPPYSNKSPGVTPRCWAMDITAATVRLIAPSSS